MFIEFDSYFLSPVQEKDAWNICDFIVSNEDRLQRYFPKTLAQNLTPTLSELFTSKKVKQFSAKEEFLFVLKEKETKQIAGLVYLKNFDWDKKQGEFAYCIGYSYERKGLISQCVIALTNYAFNTLGLKTLQIITHKTNLASVKVAEKCHFKWIKTLKNGFTPTDGQPIDMELYEIYSSKI